MKKKKILLSFVVATVSVAIIACSQNNRQDENSFCGHQGVTTYSECITVWDACAQTNDFKGCMLQAKYNLQHPSSGSSN